MRAPGLAERVGRRLRRAPADLLAWLRWGARARRSEERLALALDAAGMAIWELDVETGFMWWSDQAGRLLGTDASAVHHVRLPHLVQRLHPDDRPQFQSAIARAIGHPGAALTARCRVLWPDGKTRWLEARGQAFTEQGKLAGLRGTLVDVTEAKEREERLRRNLSELQLVAAVAEVVATSEDESSLLAHSTELLRQTLLVDNCGFLIRDRARGVLIRTASFHSAAGSQNSLAPVPLDDGVAGTVASSGVARRIDDARAERSLSGLDPEARSRVCVPLRVGSAILGVFDAESRTVGAFSADDERLLGVVVAQVASALERVRSLRALRDGGELHRAYFAASPIALFVSDTRGRWLDVNGAACALTGFTRPELLGMSAAEVFDGPGVGERLMSLIAFGDGRSEVAVRRKDGSLRHCIVHASVMGNERLLGMLLDITDRREAEEKLRESEERFRSLSEASFQPILIHDAGRIVDVNQTFCDLTHYAWHELVGRDVFELIAPEYRERVYRNMLAESERAYEIEALERDGRRRPAEVQARSFKYRGKVMRVVSIRDLAGRREAAAARDSLVHELEAKNAQLERFGSAVSQDLDVPLATVRGLAEQLERDLDEGKREGAREAARRIGEAADRLQAILDHLLALSRAASPVGLPVAVAAEELVREAHELANRTDGTLPALELRGPLPIVYGDRPRLVQVFRALIEDAVIQEPCAGATAIVIEPGAEEEGRATFVLRYREATAPREYSTVSNGVAAGGSVSSIAGLAVVKRIVESHGGRIGIGSVGGDTAILFSLPRPPASP